MWTWQSLAKELEQLLLVAPCVSPLDCGSIGRGPALECEYKIAEDGVICRFLVWQDTDFETVLQIAVLPIISRKMREALFDFFCLPTRKYSLK